MPLIWFATNDEWPALTDDDQVGAEALRRRGIDVRPGIWDDPAVPWADGDAVVLRSPWNYYLQIDAFRAWLDRLERDGVRVLNPLPTLRWNLEKTYLRQLESRGVEIVPTAWAGPHDDARLATILESHGWREAVVKPTISAGAHETWRVAAPPRDADEARFAAARNGANLMVQQYAPSIATIGEWSLLFFGGRYSHAVLKRPAGGDFRVQWYYGGTFASASPPPHVRDAAERVIAATPVPHVYARVDGVEIDGRFALMELELLEPSLWLATDAGAPDRFADAVLAAIGSRM